MDEKKCSECGRMLPVSEFSKRKGNRDGLQARCRGCFSAYNKKRYASNREKFKADVKRYKEGNPQTVLATRLKTCAEKPTHRNAYRVVEAALKAGELVNPQVCFGCGCKPPEHRIEAHHHDYARPLDIVWLCAPCHRRMDARRREHEESVECLGGKGAWR